MPESDWGVLIFEFSTHSHLPAPCLSLATVFWDSIICEGAVLGRIPCDVLSWDFGTQHRKTLKREYARFSLGFRTPEQGSAPDLTARTRARKHTHTNTHIRADDAQCGCQQHLRPRHAGVGRRSGVQRHADPSVGRCSCNDAILGPGVCRLDECTPSELKISTPLTLCVCPSCQFYRCAWRSPRGKRCGKEPKCADRGQPKW